MRNNRRASLHLTSVIWAALLIPACVTREGVQTNSAPIACETGDDAYRTSRNVTFTPPGWPEALQADVYTPRTAGLHPTILVVHGGGWIAGERSQMQDVSGLFATCGFAVVNVDYRLAPAYHFPAQVNDLQQAMRWIHNRGAAYGADPDHIGAMGYSAGAHLVALLGLIREGDPLDQPYGGTMTRLKAVVAGGTPSDLRKFTVGPLVPQFIGGSIGERPGQYAMASPVTHVHPDSPPFFLYHGTWDKLVPVDHAIDLHIDLDRVGVPNELYLMHGYGHNLAYWADERVMKDAGISFLHHNLDGP